MSDALNRMLNVANTFISKPEYSLTNTTQETPLIVEFLEAHEFVLSKLGSLNEDAREAYSNALTYYERGRWAADQGNNGDASKQFTEASNWFTQALNLSRKAA